MFVFFGLFLYVVAFLTYGACIGGVFTIHDGLGDDHDPKVLSVLIGITILIAIVATAII